jgi:hypothetical protein
VDPSTARDRLDRRRFLKLGGLTVVTTAIVAACQNKTAPPIPESGELATTTTAPDRVFDDETYLRSASSLEHNAIDAYNSLLPHVSGDIAAMMTLMRDHHVAHAAFFEQHTAAIGGTPFTTANPVVQQNMVDPYVQQLTSGPTDDQQVVSFGVLLENVLASTQQSFSPTLSTPTLRSAMMSVGGSEARHSASWTKLVNGAHPVQVLSTPIQVTTTTSGATTTTTTAAPNVATTTTIPSPAATLQAQGALFQVPGPFGSLVQAIGPNSFAYVPPKLTYGNTGG